MIKDFPLDYMHLVCLGVMKKMIVNLWMNGKPPSKLSSHQISKISQLLVGQHPNIPSEFNRKPRSLSEAKRWKATEFRLFLFYIGPVVLKTVLNHDKFLNFLSLHVSLSFLSKTNWKDNIEYAKTLLQYFVETFIVIYGSINSSHNIHNLLHICDDVERFGSLDMFSAFPFENFMRTFKKNIRKTDQPLQQIIHRIYEQDQNKNQQDCNIKKYPEPFFEHFKGPLLDIKGYKQYQKLVFENFFLSINEPDNCCRINSDIVIIKNILIGLDEMKLITQKFEVLGEFYESPCKSSELGIFLASDLSPLQEYNATDISCKCMKLDYENKYVIIPLLHSV